jgi:hypothetical protein
MFRNQDLQVSPGKKILDRFGREGIALFDLFGAGLDDRGREFFHFRNQRFVLFGEFKHGSASFRNGSPEF